MTNVTLFRSVPDLSTSGRTLEGVAIPWEKPTRVADPGKRPYLEEFTGGSADVSIRNHASFPLFVRHEHNQDPIGIVTFTRSAEGLLFIATASKTSRADEMLELVNDGAMRSTSVGFVPLKHVLKRSTLGEITSRTEVALRELSLAPTGWGQYAESRVLSLRTDDESGTPALEASRRRAALLGF